MKTNSKTIFNVLEQNFYPVFLKNKIKTLPW